MPTALDSPGAVFKQGTVTLLARIVGNDNTAIVPSDVASLHYSIFALDPCFPDSLTAVSGHEDVSLSPSDVISTTLEVGNLWTVDAIGHNFVHLIDVSSNEAFPVAGKVYQVRYELEPVEGQKIVFRYRLRVL